MSHKLCLLLGALLAIAVLWGVYAFADFPDKGEYTISAVNSIQTGDFVCDGINDDVESNQLFSAVKDGGTARFHDGDYFISDDGGWLHLNGKDITVLGSRGVTFHLANSIWSFLSVNASSGQPIVQLVDASDFDVDDHVFIRDNDSFGYYDIDSISGGNVTLSSNLGASYTDNASLWVIHPFMSVDGTNIDISHFNIQGNRSGRLGGYDLAWDGTYDNGSSMTIHRECDGEIMVGQYAYTDNVSLTYLNIQNTSMHGIAVRQSGLYGGANVGSVRINYNYFGDIGDKAIVGGYTSGKPGTIDYFEATYNIIIGTGKSNRNSIGVGQFAYGDGIQLHNVIAHKSRIDFNHIEDVARNGIYVIYGNSDFSFSQIIRNTVLGFGKRAFMSQPAAGIMVQTGQCQVTDNYIDGGWTQTNPRNRQTMGICISPAYGYFKGKSTCADNEVQNVYADISGSYAYDFSTWEIGTISGNIADECWRAARLYAPSQVTFTGNTMPNQRVDLMGELKDTLISGNTLYDIRFILNSTSERVQISTNIFTADPYGIKWDEPSGYDNADIWLNTGFGEERFYHRGDVNLDGEVNAVDITALERLIAGLD